MNYKDACEFGCLTPCVIVHRTTSPQGATTYKLNSKYEKERLRWVQMFCDSKWFAKAKRKFKMDQGA